MFQAKAAARAKSLSHMVIKRKVGGCEFASSGRGPKKASVSGVRAAGVGGGGGGELASPGRWGEGTG